MLQIAKEHTLIREVFPNSVYALFFCVPFLLSGDQQGRITVTEETEVVGESVIVDGPPVAFDKG